MHRNTLAVLTAASLACAITTLAQSPPASAITPAAAPTTAFDVVSIKPAKPGATGSGSYSRGDVYTATNATLKEILEYDAYEIPGSQILGIPPALSNAAFDIEAKMDPAVYAQLKTLSRDQRNLKVAQMVQQLLADRFKLVAHTETRQLPVYALVVANPKNGPKLQSAKDLSNRSTSLNNGRLKAEGITLEDLAQKLTRSLSDVLGHVVIDKTGLTGRYDLTLKWTADMTTSTTPNSDPNAPPDIFTAIQEQLGLKLESTKAPIPVLVVDHAELPTEN
jgi:uncharacterized protein (TIGR03435 family)